MSISYLWYTLRPFKHFTFYEFFKEFLEFFPAHLFLFWFYTADCWAQVFQRWHWPKGCNFNIPYDIITLTRTAFNNIKVNRKRVNKIILWMNLYCLFKSDWLTCPSEKHSFKKNTANYSKNAVYFLNDWRMVTHSSKILKIKMHFNSYND